MLQLDEKGEQTRGKGTRTREQGNKGTAYLVLSHSQILLSRHGKPNQRLRLIGLLETLSELTHSTQTPLCLHIPRLGPGFIIIGSLREILHVGISTLQKER